MVYYCTAPTGPVGWLIACFLVRTAQRLAWGRRQLQRPRWWWWVLTAVFFGEYAGWCDVLSSLFQPAAVGLGWAGLGWAGRGGAAVWRTE